MFKSTAWSCVLGVGLAGAAAADSWTLDETASHVAFGSVKNTFIGEVHTFSGVTGTVGADGDAIIDIALGSVETQIDIRNERMAEHVFKLTPTATLSTKIDMEALDALAVGGSKVMEVDFNLDLLGSEVALFGEVFVMRVADDQVMVTTNNMVFVETADLGIDAGIDTLQELASLDDITRAVPVTLRFMFNRDDSTES